MFPQIMSALRPIHTGRAHIMPANGTCCCQWECSHCLQAKSKEKCSNLRARRVARPVWIRPEAQHSNSAIKNFPPLSPLQRMLRTQTHSSGILKHCLIVVREPSSFRTSDLSIWNGHIEFSHLSVKDLRAFLMNKTQSSHRAPPPPEYPSVPLSDFTSDVEKGHLSPVMSFHLVLGPFDNSKMFCQPILQRVTDRTILGKHSGLRRADCQRSVEHHVF